MDFQDKLTMIFESKSDISKPFIYRGVEYIITRIIQSTTIEDELPDEDVFGDNYQLKTTDDHALATLEISDDHIAHVKRAVWDRYEPILRLWGINTGTIFRIEPTLT